jgi:hypothetical protein
LLEVRLRSAVRIDFFFFLFVVFYGDALAAVSAFVAVLARAENGTAIGGANARSGAVVV